MLFNSIEFALFLPIMFCLYWLANRSLKLQNALVLLGSYVFYGWWDWRFLSLIVFSSFVDFFIGVKLHATENPRNRKMLLLASLVVNLGFLGFFKYYNFFAESFADAFTILGGSLSVDRLRIILPVGISFYTFQTLSYSIDVYKKRLEPTRDFIAFFAFVSFFPQLVAGPIERAANLLPQFYSQRKFEYAKAADGMRQILWGLFKKIVIADNCAHFANQIFDSPDAYSASTLALGAVLFTFQIYGDFSGYSDIAIGTARLFGFNLMQNFAFPYFSRDIAEFWRRWHISLSTWFRDYVYIPLGGSRGGTAMSIRNTFVIFVVSGFWHGANWTFIVWGALNAVYFLPLLLMKRNRRNTGAIAENRLFPALHEIWGIASTFSLTVIAWVFFRAENISHALLYLKGMLNSSLFSVPDILPMKIAALLVLFIAIEWTGRNNQYAIEGLALKTKPLFRWSMYIGIAFIIFLFQGEEQAFIYFQF